MEISQKNVLGQGKILAGENFLLIKSIYYEFNSEVTGSKI
jgi:hypothetical protein